MVHTVAKDPEINAYIRYSAAYQAYISSVIDVG